MQVVDAAEELRLTEALSVDGELSPGVGSSCQIDSENRAGGSPYPVAFNLYRIALTLFQGVSVRGFSGDLAACHAVGVYRRGVLGEVEGRQRVIQSQPRGEGGGTNFVPAAVQHRDSDASCGSGAPGVVKE